MRMIKPEFWNDCKIIELNFMQRLLFIGLWNFASDEGTLNFTFKSLKAQIFPADNINLNEIENALKNLVRLDLIIIYNDKQKNYIQIKNWTKHQTINKPTPSFIPIYDNELHQYGILREECSSGVVAVLEECSNTTGILPEECSRSVHEVKLHESKLNKSKLNKHGGKFSQNENITTLPDENSNNFINNKNKNQDDNQNKSDNTNNNTDNIPPIDKNHSKKPIKNKSDIKPIEKKEPALFRQFTDIFTKAYLEKYKSKYDFKTKEDGTHTKHLMKLLDNDIDKWSKICHSVINDDYWFNKDTAITLGTIRKHINQIIPEINKKINNPVYARVQDIKELQKEYYGIE